MNDRISDTHDGFPATAGQRILPRNSELIWPLPTARVRWRGLVVVLVLTSVLLVLLAVALSRGDYPVSVTRVPVIVAGGGTDIERTIVVQWRLGRALVAVVIGLCLGVSGAITQSIARNALASPDILGISMGASVAAVAVIVLGGSGVSIAGVLIGVPVAALCGGLATAVVIYLLALKNGVDPYRLVLIGIGVNALLGSLVTWLLVIADIRRAEQATLWLTGSLNGRGWPEFVPLVIVFLVSVPVLLVSAFDLRPLHFGRDLSVGLGVRVTVTQALVLLVAIALTSVTVAAAGPIGFVAFVSPQVARLLTGSPTPPLAAGALTGAIIILAADIVTGSVLPWTLPVGVATAAIGGPFLIFLLIRTNRKVTL
ncbi:FecCD family ABC transporter permease [Corynebacterium sp. TAE3-ERU16]|uniref:FecCD family ABC transporter permease n=1 Tax=Corynebacterium sp. TAE3-ERU16 TaxID=2849493 RepID=UPI00351DA77D